MKRKQTLLFLLVFFTVSFTFILSSGVHAADIEISEIMYDPSNTITGMPQDSFMCVNDSSCQWIELHNKGNSSVDLSSWKLKVNTKTNGNNIYDFGNIEIQPGEYIIIATQLGDEEGDGYSFSKLYGNKDGIWDANVDGFRAVDSNIPFLSTIDLTGSGFEEIKLISQLNENVDSLSFFWYYQGPDFFVQSNNGYSMEKDSRGVFMQSLNLGGSPGKKRNVPPIFSSIPNLNLNEDQELDSRLIDFRSFVSDPDNSDDELVFSIASINSNPSNLITCGLVGTEEDPSKTYFLNCTSLGKDLNGNANVTVSANDGVLSASKDFKIIVNPVNDAPVITSSAVENAVAGMEWKYDTDASDIEGNNFTFSLIKFPAGMTINSTSGEIKWTPSESQIGDHEVEVRVADTTANSKSSTQKFTITVDPIFGFSNVDVDYSGGNLNNVNSSQTLQSVFTSSKFKIIPTILNRHPVEQGADIVVDDIEVKIKVVKNGNGIVIVDDVISSGFLLNSLGSRQLEYEFDIPRNLDEGIYTLTLEAEGKLFDIDENFRDIIVTQSRKFELLLDVQQARHDVFISSMRVDDGNTCRPTSNLEVTVQNSGTRTERNLLLNIDYPSLGIDSLIEIPLIQSGGNNKQIINFTNAPGNHNITAILTYNNGQNTDTKILENFTSCIRLGDLDVDYCVGGKDVELLVSKMGLKSTDKTFEDKFDIAKNNIVDADDFFRLADIIEVGCPAALLPTPPAPAPVPPPNVGDSSGIGASASGFRLDSAQIKLLIQQGGSLISKLKITNNENTSIAIRNNLEGIFSSSDKIISFDFLKLLNIFSSASNELEIKASVPENFKLGLYKGTFKVESNVKTELIPFEVEVTPDFCSSGIRGEDLSISVNDPDRNDDFKPGETINVDMKVRNKGKDKDVAVEAFLWNIDKDDEVESLDVDTVSLDRGDDENFEFEIDVPDDVEDDKIVLYIKASDEDEEESQCLVRSVGLDVERDQNDVRITSITLPDTLICNTSYSAKTNARNFGRNDAEDVFFRIANNDLGIALESDKFDLREFDKSGDSTSRIFSFDVPLKTGDSTFNIDVVYDGNEINSVTKQVKVECDKIDAETIKSTDTATTTGNFIRTVGREAGSNLLFNTTASLVVITLILGALYYIKSSFLLKK